MSSERGLEILKNWKIAEASLESNSITLFDSSRSTFVKVRDVETNVLVVEDESGWLPIPLSGSEEFDGIEPTEFSPLRALQIRLSGGLVLFIERTGKSNA